MAQDLTNTTMKKRFITKTRNSQDRPYEALKPGEDGGWKSFGRKYNRRGLYNLMKTKGFEFIIDPNCREEIEGGL